MRCRRRRANPSEHQCDAERAGQIESQPRRLTLLLAYQEGDISQDIITPRRLERILRDAGIPRRFAKALLAGGFRAASSQVEADPTPDVADLAARLQRAADLLKGLQQ